MKLPNTSKLRWQHDEYLFVDSTNARPRGDVQDWDLESSRMAGVYRNATLTLSATHAASDTEGFLVPRPSTHTTVRITSQSGKYEDVYIQAAVGGKFGGQYESANHRIQPLDTRGWCLQESYLSRRQLKFLDEKILWSCQDIELDESKLGEYC